MTAPEYVFHVGRWADKPKRYRALHRTAKTVKVQEDSGDKYQSAYQRIVRSADVGSEWFISERDGWEALRVRCSSAIESAKHDLQRERSALGTIEARLDALDRAESGDAVATPDQASNV